MKILYWTVVGSFAATMAFGQQSSAPATTINTNQRPIFHGTKNSVIQRDANSRVWQWEVDEQSPSGQVIPRVHTYTELATGMHYQKDNEWVESKEEIDPVPTGGAAAVQGQHQVYFPYDIYSGVVEIVTMDGEHIKNRPIALTYFDGTNNVLLAQITNSVGQIVSSNQVIYTNAFAGVNADLVCTYRRSGFECDLVFRAQPPAPELFGLNSVSTRLELFTEFFDTPDPETIAATPSTGLLPANSFSQQSPATEENPADVLLKFGSMTMVHGRAFAVNAPETVGQSQTGAMQSLDASSVVSNADNIVVSKTWTNLEARTFLIEQVPVLEINPGLQQLPLASVKKGSSLPKNIALQKLPISQLLPPRHIAQSNTNNLQLAKAAIAQLPGVVLDYNIVNSQTNLTFCGDTTYYVSGAVNLYGTNVIEGGAVIKYDTNSTCAINILGSVQCKTGPYRPAIFTSVSDASVGDSISTSVSSSCTNDFALLIKNDTTEDIAMYLDDPATGDMLINGTVVSAGTSQLFSLTVGPGQDLAFEGDSDTDVYGFGDFWPSLGSGTIEIFADKSSGYSETGSALCTPPIFGATALSLANGGNLNDLVIRNVGTGITSYGNYAVTNMQLVNCHFSAFDTENASLYAGNVLISGAGTAFIGRGFNVQAEQLTYDNGENLAFSRSGSSTVALTNAIITGVNFSGSTVAVTIHTNHVRIGSASGVYQTSGAGNYYLATNSPYRDAGTTNINPSLLASLSYKTTYPPIIYSNVFVSTNITLNPQALRDTDIPDLGYHYHPLDYVVDILWLTNATLTVTAGTAVACYNSAGGFVIPDGSTINSIGTAASPNWFTRYSSAQEQPAAIPTGAAPGSTLMVNSHWIDTSPNGTFRFTKFSCPAGGGTHLYTSGQFSYGNLLVQDCEFWGGLCEFDGNNWTTTTLKNNLFARVACTASGGAYTNNTLSCSNSLFWNLSLTVLAGANTNTWSWFNNQFYNASISIGKTGNGLVVNGYNAYMVNTNRLKPVNAGDVVTTDPFAFVTGRLGDFYQPMGSILANAGSVTADLTGLYHYTTTTNQVKETNSVVDIGYHYVAVDTNGNPIDSDSDGVPDYLEDANGNGMVDTGEDDWRKADLGIWISHPSGLTSTP